MTSAAFTLAPDPSPTARPPRWWQARFARNVATQQHVYGYPPADARRRGYFDTLTDLVESDPALRLLPSSAAEPLAREALAELGVTDPREGARTLGPRTPTAPGADPGRLPGAPQRARGVGRGVNSPEPAIDAGAGGDD